MSRVIVIGGGMAGLAAAYRLKLGDHDVTVFEAAGRFGGVVHSERVDGYLVEHGPNSIQRGTELIESLVRELGLEDERVEASPAARNRYVVRNGRLVAAPRSPAGLLTSRLFSAGGILRILREPFVLRSDGSVDESVADFVRRRLGSEVLDYGVNPFVAGVFAGDPEHLSVRHAFPRLVALEKTHGSIIRGEIAGRRQGDPDMPRMFSFREGVETLPVALASALDACVRPGTRVTGLERRNAQWHVTHTTGSEMAESVICAVPLHRLGEISTQVSEHVARLAQVTYPALSVVALGYRRGDVAHPLDGFGLLVPEVERDLRILGTIFNSSLFPGRAPEDHVLLTSFVGGMRAPELAHSASEDLYRMVHDDLTRLLQITSGPVFRKHVLWRHAIPQYTLGYDDVLATIDRLENALPGCFMAGNYRSGISMGDAAASGERAARQAAEYVSRHS